MEKITRDRVYPPSSFEYDNEKDIYICPNKCVHKYSSVNKTKRRKVYRASQIDCKNCPLRENCIGGATKRSRVFEVSFFKKEIESQRAIYGSVRYLEIQKKGVSIAKGILPFKKTIII